MKKSSLGASSGMRTGSLAPATNSISAASGTEHQTAGFTVRKNSFNLTFRPKDLEAPSSTGAIYVEEQQVQAPRHSEEMY
mgnify:CR=1 FL=1